MNYQTFLPSAELASFVKCYWTLKGSKESLLEKQTIVPDGCMEMIFHCGDLYRQFFPDDTSIIQPRSFVFGQLSAPLEIEPTGRTDIFSVRFHMEGFLPFANSPIKEMENRAVPLDELFGREADKLQTTVLNAADTLSRIEIVEQFLREQLAEEATIDRLIQSTLEIIWGAKGQYSVNQLSEAVQVHRRKLERKFASNVGLSPKQLSMIVRIQATLRQLLDNDYQSLTQLAYGEGYYDQAHFIKDFKAFTGQTPKEFYSDHLKMSALFYGAK